MNSITPLPLPLSLDGDKIATLTLEANHGPMVILDQPLIERLASTLRLVKANPPAGLILVSGSPRVFIAGADLKSIVAMNHAQLEGYLRYGQEIFGMLCTLPCPTAAAINGAALGGGLELAMHCDALIASKPGLGKDGAPAKPYPIGLPEAGLKICPGWGGTNLLPARMDPHNAISRTCEGRPMTFDEAVAARLFDAVADSPDTLIATCKAWLKANTGVPGKRRDGYPLRWIGNDASRNHVTKAFSDLSPTLMHHDPAKACMLAIRAGLEHGWQAALTVERTELNRLRHEPEGKSAIEAFLSKSK